MPPKLVPPSPWLDRPLRTQRQEVSLSSFAFLFSELVQYHQSRVSSVTELERKLDEAGYEVGSRMLEVLVARERANRRETRLQGVLQFVHTNVWRSLFGRPADSLEIYKDDEYIIGDRDLLVNRFVSVPRDLGSFNCGAFVAGVVRGCLDAAGFPATVSAYATQSEGAGHRTNVLMKFSPSVIEREARLGG